MSIMLTQVEKLLQEAKDVLIKAANEIEVAAAVGIDAMDTKTKLQLLMMLRDYKNVGSLYEGLHNKYVDEITTRLYKELEALGVEKIEVAYNGSSYNVKADQNVYASVADENWEAFLAFMDAHPKGKELVTRNVHPKTLNKFVEEDIVGAGALPPKCINIFIKENINVRKLPKKS